VMPKLLYARPPADAEEERQVRKLAGSRHAPAGWVTCPGRDVNAGSANSNGAGSSRWPVRSHPAGRSARRAGIKAPLEYSRGPDKVWVYGGLRIRDGVPARLADPPPRRTAPDAADEAHAGPQPRRTPYRRTSDLHVEKQRVQQFERVQPVGPAAAGGARGNPARRPGGSGSSRRTAGPDNGSARRRGFLVSAVRLSPLERLKDQNG
jgi:hypothetical protein